jgi:hypothetical protein
LNLIFRRHRWLTWQFLVTSLHPFTSHLEQEMILNLDLPCHREKELLPSFMTNNLWRGRAVHTQNEQCFVRLWQWFNCSKMVIRVQLECLISF